MLWTLNNYSFCVYSVLLFTRLLLKPSSFCFSFLPPEFHSKAGLASLPTGVTKITRFARIIRFTRTTQFTRITRFIRFTSIKWFLTVKKRSKILPIYSEFIGTWHQFSKLFLRCEPSTITWSYSALLAKKVLSSVLLENHYCGGQQFLFLSNSSIKISNPIKMNLSRYRFFCLYFQPLNPFHPLSQKFTFGRDKYKLKRTLIRL